MDRPERIKTREQTYMELMVNDGRIHQRTHLIN
jgi:hypothetical protein